jgi:uncharacterized membrane protein YfcA
VVAAFFQTVAGVGFGMVAGPVVLMVLDDPAAVLISTLISWLISVALWPGLRRGTDRTMLLRLTGGAVLGVPVGLGLLAVLDIYALKLLAGALIGALTAMMVFGAPGMRVQGRAGDLIFGALGGIFGGCLAMPGPTAAVRMTALGYPKATTRATMVSFFCLIWPVIFLGQVATAGVATQTLWNALMLVPATLAGIVAGNWAARRVSEAVFRRLVIAILAVSSATLLGRTLWLGG